MDSKYTYLVCVECKTFNHHAYIEDAMNGFVMQKTDFPYVCVIIDDASTDSEPEVIQKYFHENFELLDTDETNDYVRVYGRHKNNENCYFLVVYLKYNHYSIKKNKLPYYQEYQDNAKYISICEGDDYWIVDDRLQMQVDFLEENGDYGACANESIVLHLNSGEKTLRNGSQVEYDVTVEETLNRLYEDKREAWQFSGFIFRKKFIESQPNFISKLKIAGDMSLDLYILAESKVRFNPKVVSVYRLGTESSIYRMRLPDHIDMHRQQIDMLSGFDEYTQHKYHEGIGQLIKHLQYKDYEEREEYKKMLQKDMRIEFYSHRFMYRVKIYVCAYCPFIKQWYKKIKYAQK